MNTQIDLKLGIHPQAWAIATLLSEHDFDLKHKQQYHNPPWQIETRAFYNGRERGIILVVYNWLDPRLKLCVFFTEARNSDQIIVVPWEDMVNDVNPPTIDRVPEGAWNGAKHFDWNETAVAAVHIRKLVQRWIDQHNRETEDEQE
jgi:hypothetical protein